MVSHSISFQSKVYLPAQSLNYQSRKPIIKDSLRRYSANQRGLFIIIGSFLSYAQSCSRHTKPKVIILSRHWIQFANRSPPSVHYYPAFLFQQKIFLIFLRCAKFVYNPQFSEYPSGNPRRGITDRMAWELSNSIDHIEIPVNCKPQGLCQRS
jgi:hypothetical protein